MTALVFMDTERQCPHCGEAFTVAYPSVRKGNRRAAAYAGTRHDGATGRFLAGENT